MQCSQKRRNGLSPAAGSESGAAVYVGRVQSLGALLAFEFNRIALVQGLVAVLLDGGEMYKHIFAGGTLNESVPFSSVEPLHYAIFLQAKSLSSLDSESPASRRNTKSRRSEPATKL